MLPDTLTTCPSRTAWQKHPRQHLSRLGGLTSHIDLQFSHTRWGYHTQHRTTFVHTWGLKNSSPSACQDYYPQHQTDSLDTGQIRSALDNLFWPQAGSELGGLMYCTGATKYMWHPTWHFETRVNHSHQSYYRSTDARLSAAELPTNRLSLTY